MRAGKDPLVPDFSPKQASNLARRLFGVTASAHGISSERDQNFRLAAADGSAFILKIANAGEDLPALACQNAVLAHLAEAAPEIPVPRVVAAVDGSGIAMVEGRGTRHAVRLLTCLPGENASARARSSAFRLDVGRIAAALDEALADFPWSAGDRHLIWDLRHALAMREHVGFVEPPARRTLIAAAFDRFERLAAPLLASLPAQVIHNDLNANNLLVDPARPNRVAGIIDFGDLVHSCRVFEVAVAATHQSLGEADALAAVAEVATGYDKAAPLRDDELTLLPVLVLARLAVRMTVIAQRKAARPGDTHFDPRVEASAWATIDALVNADMAALGAAFGDRRRR